MKVRLLTLLLLFVSLASNAQDYTIMYKEFLEAIDMQKKGQFQQAHIKMMSIAEKGFPLAQIEVGRNFDSGMGCSVDFNEAFKWMSKAAYNTTWDKVPEPEEQGTALFYLGVYNMAGMGTSKDMTKAVELWQKGSSYHSFTQNICYLQLGFGYQRGWGGLEEDLAKAKDMFMEASRLGNPDAPYYIAEFYAQGLGGVSQSDTEALYWIKLSADRGYADGQCILGEIYYNGYLGQSKDYSLAIEFFKKAAKQGQSEAIGYLTELGESW